ncbi:MAG: hypothetical protein MJZ11_10730 [Lachnospiraceae bacterium]|nr:hypothetical protein [Lachnospiraceae bacterium]
MIRDTFEFYGEVPAITPEQIKRENEVAEYELNIQKQFILKTIVSKNDDYVVAVPGQDGIFMNKVDAKTKADTEKLVKHFLDNASYIVGNGNVSDNLPHGFKRDICEATKDRLFTIVTIYTENDKICLFY